MLGMAKKRPTGSDQPGKKRYPSRENTKYVAIPLELHEALQAYADSRSDEDDKKSVTWAARVAIRKFLTDIGLWPPKPTD